MSDKVSIIIPARNEQFLAKTVDDIIRNATGNIEIIVILDGYWDSLPDHPGLTIIHRSQAKGMRHAINSAAAIAKGKYLLKTDAHCMFAHGFDETLKANCDGDWIVIPARFSLDPEAWGVKHTGKARVDYHYLCHPTNGKKDDDPGMHARVWNERARQRLNNPEYNIDEEMSFQGSCWFMPRKHFTDFLGGMDEQNYGTFIQEPQEIGLKTWLGGGKVMVNKLTWYAHLHKGKTYGRGYSISKNSMVKGSAYSTDFWMNNRWTGRKHDLEWLIDKFAPVPTWE